MAGKGASELSFEERNKIREFLDQGCKTGRIASILGRSHSCIKQEIRKGGGKLTYDAKKCHQDAQERNETRKRKLRRNFTESQIELINEGISFGLSLNKISEKLGITNYRLASYVRQMNIKYKSKSYLGVDDRICSLEMQMEILTEQIKEMQKCLK